MARYEPPDYSIVSYARNAEDVVLMRAFAGCRNGMFVDVGAGEPDAGSLTKNLVEKLGWHGVNIEPLPERFASLARSRPGDVSLSVAVGLQPGRTTFHRVVPPPGRPGGAGLSTLRSDVAQQHLSDGFIVEQFEVTVVTLESVLNAHAGPDFDLLKVDVEGMEAAVLTSADLRYWRPKVIIVEATVPNRSTPNHQEWEPLVLAAGYRMTLFDGLNRFYVRSDLRSLAERLSVPANVFDRWIPAAWAMQLGHPV